MPTLWGVVRGMLVFVFFSVIACLTISAADSVLVRGRDASALSIGIVALALTWDAARFFLIHSGVRLAASAISVENITGRFCFGVGFAMTLVSIGTLSLGLHAAMEPTHIEKSAASKNESAEAQRKMQKAMASEYEALVTTNQLTRARQLRAEMMSNAPVTGSNEIVQNSTQIVRSSYFSKNSRSAWVLCVFLAVVIELAMVGVLIAKPKVTHPLPAVTAKKPRVTSENDQEQLMEELRTGALQPTVSAVRIRMGCGTAKAAQTLRRAKDMGIVAGG